MSDLIWLSEAQMRRIELHFPWSHDVWRVDDRRIVSGVIFVIGNGLRWRDAPKEYGPHKTIYNRFIRWSCLGVFNRIFAELAAKSGKPRKLMINATHSKAHRTAVGLLKKGLFPDLSGGITKAGDVNLRRALIWLRTWAVQIARRRGRKRAMVALARRIGVVLHRIWVDGTAFQPQAPIIPQGI
jgi:transposase